MAHRPFEIRFPTGGLDKLRAQQDQPPFTTPDCLNVIPRDPDELRSRGGQRPGLGRYGSGANSATPPAANPNMLVEAFYTATDGLLEYDEKMDGTQFGSDWVPLAGESLPTRSGRGRIEEPYTAGAWRSALRDFPDLQQDTTASNYSNSLMVGIYIVPYNGKYGAKYRVWALADRTSPSESNAAYLEMVPRDDGTGSVDFTFFSKVNNVWQGPFTGSLTFSKVESGWLFLRISRGAGSPGFIAALWRGRFVFDAQYLTFGDTTQATRFGFGINVTDQSSVGQIESFHLTYFGDQIAPSPRRSLVVVSNGFVHKEEAKLGFSRVSSPVTIQTRDLVRGVAYAQQVFIPDSSRVKYRASQGVAAVNGVRTVPALTADQQAAIDINSDTLSILSIRNPSSGAPWLGSFKILSYTNDTVNNEVTWTVDRAIDLANTADVSEMVVMAGAKVFDPRNNGLGLWQSRAPSGENFYGNVPPGVRQLAVWRDRIVAAGSELEPQMWYMSRQGDPYDWNYGADPDDPQRAIAGINADAGQAPDRIVALCPWSDDFLVLGCQRSMWVMRGDPALGGILDALSYEVGIVGPFAWTWGPDGELVFLSRSGLYMIPPGANARPQSLSENRLPNDLRIPPATNEHFSLVYDHYNRAVLILRFATDGTGRTYRSWWFDWNTRTYWPLEFPASMQPMFGVEHTRLKSSARVESRTALLCVDGVVRELRRTAETDDDVAINSYVWIGPIPLGRPGISEGKLVELTAIVGERSGDVNYSVHVSQDAEKILVTSAFATGTWKPGVNTRNRPRARGQAFALKLSGAGREWHVESIGAARERAGKLRRG